MAKVLFVASPLMLDDQVIANMFILGIFEGVLLDVRADTGCRIRPSCKFRTLTDAMLAAYIDEPLPALYASECQQFQLLVLVYTRSSIAF